MTESNIKTDNLLSTYDGENYSGAISTSTIEEIITPTIEEKLVTSVSYKQTSMISDSYKINFTAHTELFMRTVANTTQVVSNVAEVLSKDGVSSVNNMPEITIESHDPMTTVIADKYDLSTILTFFKDKNESDDQILMTINISDNSYEVVHTQQPEKGISEAANSVKVYTFWMDWRFGISYIFLCTFFLFYSLDIEIVLYHTLITKCI